MRLGPYACTTYPARRQGTWSKRRRCSRTVGYYRTEVVYPLIVFQIFAVRQASIRQLRPTDFSFRQHRMLTLPLHCLLLIEWSFIDRTWCRQHCGYRADCNAHTYIHTGFPFLFLFLSDSSPRSRHSTLGTQYSHILQISRTLIRSGSRLTHTHPLIH